MPQTISTTVYTFDELSDEAKEVAIQNERNGRSYFNDIPWRSEYADSLSAFCDRFGVTTDVHYDDRNYIRQSTLPEYGESIRGLRLRTYVINNYSDVLYERKKQYVNGYGSKHRISRVFMTETCCPFTHFCGDEALLQPIRDFVTGKTSHRPTYDLNDLLSDCVHSFNLAWECEVDTYYSDETITEYLREWEFQFTEDGELA